MGGWFRIAFGCSLLSSDKVLGVFTAFSICYLDVLFIDVTLPLVGLTSGRLGMGSSRSTCFLVSHSVATNLHS